MRRHQYVLAASLAVLAGILWFGWTAPPAGLDQPSTADDLWLDVARRAAGPGNRSARPRLEPAPASLPGDPGPQTITMVLRADDAGDEPSMRRGIRDDAWAIFRAIFEDARLEWIDEVRLIVTHPRGSIRSLEGEPPVAQIRLDRQRFQRLNPEGVNPQRLEDIAEVRWLPPLAGS